MAKPGRPTKYTKALGLRICACIATEVISLDALCRREKAFPTARTVWRWLAKHEAFCQEYASAKEQQAMLMADEMLEIADDGRNDWMERENRDGSTHEVVNHEAIQRSRLRIDTRKWLLSKLIPKKYGDLQKLELTGKDGGPVKVTAMDLVEECEGDE